MYLHPFAPLLSFMFNIVCQVSYCRYKRKSSLLVSIFFGFFVGLLSLFFIEGYSLRHLSVLDGLGYTLVNTITYSALGYGYFHFLNLGETARRIRLLIELADACEGLSLPELLKRYSHEEIVEKRLRRLLKSSQIISKDNRYYIGKPFMLIASKMILFLKLCILGKKSEFD